VFQTIEQSIRVMSYNILTRATDGQTVPGSLTQASWWQRRTPMVALIKAANPDVIGVQEGGSPTNGWMSPRQVDTLQTALGSTYTVARTEALAGQPGYELAGNYIVYRNTTWAPVGNGGHYLINGPGAGFNGAWQVLRSRRTGAEVMVVSTHLSSGNDAAGCALRARETSALIAGAASIAANVRSGGVPILYTGDFASAPVTWLPDDSPGRLMRTTAQANDSYWAAPVFRNDRWNTMNKYRRVVEVGGTIIDRVFGTPGVAVHYWAQSVHEYAGKFVGVIPSDHNPVYTDLSIQG
jgi:endonuclease/exonuclease/phosphatase family metal-dependent hydrolase